MKMDERAKSEFYKINQEKFFISVIIIAIFLIIKINLQVNILGMLGEITAAAVIFIYLIPYFVIRYKYKVIDEMVKKKLYKLSSAFFIAEMASMIPVIVISLAIVFNQLDRLEPMRLMDSSFPFIITLIIVTNIYSLIRMHNDKFVTREAAEISLQNYKRKLLIRATIATVVMIALIVAFAVISNYISGKAEYPDSETLSRYVISLDTGILLCVLGIPTCWFLYFYYLSMRKQLAKRLQNSDESEKASLNQKKKFLHERLVLDGILFVIFLFVVAMADSMIQGDDKKIGISILIYGVGLAIYLSITLTIYFIQKKIFTKNIDESTNKKESQDKEGK